MKKNTVIAVALSSSVLLSACSSLYTVNRETEYTDAVDQTGITAVTTMASQTEVSESTTPAVTETAATTTASSSESLETQESSSDSDIELGEALTPEQTSEFYAAHADEYLMSSGAGGWAAYFNVDASGSFVYNYHDFDIGKYYICHAQGTLGEVTQIDDYTYTVEVLSMTYEYNEGDEWTETDMDGIEIDYVAADSYGIHEGDILYFYLDGIDISQLSEDYLRWYAAPRAVPFDEVPNPFPVAGYYNAVEGAAYIEDTYE